MFVAIDMVEDKTSVPEGLKLGSDFLFQLPSDPGPEEKIDPGPEETGGKFAPRVQQAGHHPWG